MEPIKQVDNKIAALALIKIAYEKGDINEKTYLNIQKKYGIKIKRDSQKENSLFVVLLLIILYKFGLIWYNGIKGRRILKRRKTNE